MALDGSLTAGYWYDDYGKSRGYTLSWSAEQSIAENKSLIRWSVSTAGTYAYQVAERTLSVTLAGKTLIDKTERVMRGAGVVASGSFDVAHDANGNLSIGASIRAAVYYSTVNCSNSGSWSLNQIPRQANISSAPDFNDEENPTIIYSNPAGNAVSSLDACISLTGAKDDIPYRDISKTGNSYTFYLTDAERETLRNACTTANRRNVAFFVRTEIGGTTFYSSLTKSLSIVNANPVITETNAEDIKESTIAVTLDNQKVVKGCSEMEVSMSASALKGATIEKYRIKNGTAEIGSRSGSFSNAESGTFLFSVTDSRGNTTEQTVELPLIDYVKLTCNMNEKAPNAEGNLSFTITGNCFAGTFGEIENEVHVYLQYAENGGEFSDWVEYETILGMDNRYETEISMTGLNYQSSFTFRAMARDLLSEVESPQKTVRTVPIFDWGEKDFNFNVPVNLFGGIKECVLYEDESGSNLEIHLSESAEKFTYLELYYMDNNGRRGGYLKVYNPNGKIVDLSIIEGSDENVTYIRRTRYWIDGNTIAPEYAKAGYVLIQNQSVTQYGEGYNFLRITRVIGHR